MIYSSRRSDRTVRYSITPLSPRRRAPPAPCPRVPERAGSHTHRAVARQRANHPSPGKQQLTRGRVGPSKPLISPVGCPFRAENRGWPLSADADYCLTAEIVSKPGAGSRFAGRSVSLRARGLDFSTCARSGAIRRLFARDTTAQVAFRDGVLVIVRPRLAEDGLPTDQRARPRSSCTPVLALVRMSEHFLACRTPARWQAACSWRHGDGPVPGRASLAYAALAGCPAGTGGRSGSRNSGGR
jgi:hypothetical protein